MFDLPDMSLIVIAMMYITRGCSHATGEICPTFIAHSIATITHYIFLLGEICSTFIAHSIRPLHLFIVCVLCVLLVLKTD